jgi:hypothetical protein
MDLFDRKQPAAALAKKIGDRLFESGGSGE